MPHNNIVEPELPAASFSSNGFGTTMGSLTGGNPVNFSDVRRLFWLENAIECQYMLDRTSLRSSRFHGVGIL
jgi:hypothetical protein